MNFEFLILSFLPNDGGDFNNSKLKIQNSKSLRPLVERQRHNLRAYHFSAYVDFDRLAHAGEFGRYVTHPDVFLEKGRRTSRRHFAGRLAIDKQRLIVAGNPAISHFEAN